jgi:hypothetical protein
MAIIQALKHQDTVNRKSVYGNPLKSLGNDGVNQVLKTDEANFNFCGYVKSQNCRYWATDEPRDIRQERSHSDNVATIWDFVAFFGLIGRHLMEDEAGTAVAVNSPGYFEHISGTGFAETWCRNPGSLVSARWGNGSNCEEYNESLQRDSPTRVIS